MSLPSGIIDREQDKFKDTAQNTAIKVAIVEGGGGGGGGDASLAEQQVQSASLASIDTKLTSPITVQSTNLDIRDLTFLNDKVDASGSIVGLDATSLAALENINVTVTSIGEVEIKNDSGSPVPVSASSLPLPSGAATSALQTQPGVDIGDVTINNTAGASAVNIQDGGNSITVDGTVSVSGSVAVTGPLTDAQLRASGVPVSVSNFPTTQQTSDKQASSASLSNVTSSASSVTISASNASRRGLYIYNDSTKKLYVKFGSTATTSSFTLIMAPDTFYEMQEPIYTGVIDGVWPSVNGAARITELT